MAESVELPRRYDIREGDNPNIPIVVRRNGVACVGVVAYDLDAGTVTELLLDETSKHIYIGGRPQYRTLRGGVTGHWARDIE